MNNFELPNYLFGGPIRKVKQRRERMILTMGIKCNNCGNHMLKGTIFNSNKEELITRNIRICRLYIKCFKCLSEVILKVESSELGYIIESGATKIEELMEVDTNSAPALTGESGATKIEEMVEDDTISAPALGGGGVSSTSQT
ncbi:hypothetical protein AQUCO_02200116v1 [Aquilegia coerulea]|uniref:Splicing factor YJU2 n=1 Tax=Aquilegia coerulea TaxID=218851 RepID=A0A2G5DDC8_AQUCA|nr:hypothetical protein AQUCO_02200116v1 [Aquilegia coerulea]